MYTIFNNLKRSFAKNIREGKINLDNADKDQDYLLLETGNFSKSTKPRNVSKKSIREILLKAWMLFMKVERWFLMLLKVEYFQYFQLKKQVIQICQLAQLRSLP